jgi:uncharacterized Zn finger protein
MEHLCREKTGLFPAPAEIEFSCSCPDWASMCKHVAAVLYGIGARLDERPELLFKLRKVDEKDLIAKSGRGLALAKTGPAAEKVLAQDGLSELFGLEMEAEAATTADGALNIKSGRRRRVHKRQDGQGISSAPMRRRSKAKTAAKRTAG